MRPGNGNTPLTPFAAGPSWRGKCDGKAGGAMRRIILIGVGVVALALLIMFGGGSAVWWAAGLGKDLSINGTAAAVAPADPNATEGWPAYGGDAGGSRYSAANEITRENVKDLKVAWQFRTKAF